MNRDEKLIIALLFGHNEPDEHGLPACRYLAKGSDEELDARRAFARLLRSSRPLDMGLRCALAGLIDADLNIEREIQFVNRPRNGRPSKNKNSEFEIAQFVRLQEHALGKKEAAIAAARKRFGLTRSRLFKICKKWQPVFEFREKLAAGRAAAKKRG